MVLDPASIAGLVGTAAGLLGFVVGNIEKTRLTGEAIFHADQIRNDQIESLEDCQGKLYFWASDWHGNNRFRTEQDLEQRLRLLWGKVGFAEIEARKDRIMKRASHIEDLLYGVSIFDDAKDVDKRAAAQWKSCLDAEKEALEGGFRRRTRRPHVPVLGELCERVNLALGKKALLQDAIGALKNQIAELQGVAMRWFKIHHLGGYTCPDINADDLNRREELQKIAANLCGITSALHQNLNGYCTGWTFAFTPRDTGPDEWLYQEDLSIDLLLLNPDQTRPQLSRWEAVIRDFHSQENAIARVARQEASGYYGVPQQSVRETFWNLTYNVDEDGRRETKRETKLKRLRTALDVVQWATVLWSSPWVHALSCCKLKMHGSPLDGVPFFHGRPCACAPLPQETCVLAQTQQRPYLRLALLLTELALATPIIISYYHGGSFKFSTRDHPDLNIPAMLSRVRGATSNSGYVRAVQYCFIRDEQQVRGHLDGIGPMAEYLVRVVEPVKRYYDLVLAQRPSSSRERLKEEQDPVRSSNPRLRRVEGSI